MQDREVLSFFSRDYCCLHCITVENKYLLDLLSSDSELLQTATIFTKLDFSSTYRLVCKKDRDEWKTPFNTHLCHSAVFQALVNDIRRYYLNRSFFHILEWHSDFNLF